MGIAGAAAACILPGAPRGRLPCSERRPGGPFRQVGMAGRSGRGGMAQGRLGHHGEIVQQALRWLRGPVRRVGLQQQQGRSLQALQPLGPEVAGELRPQLTGPFHQGTCSRSQGPPAGPRSPPGCTPPPIPGRTRTLPASWPPVYRRAETTCLRSLPRECMADRGLEQGGLRIPRAGMPWPNARASKGWDVNPALALPAWPYLAVRPDRRQGRCPDALTSALWLRVGGPIAGAAGPRPDPLT